MVIPVTVVEDGELKFIGNDVEHGNAGTANDDAKYKGGSLITNAKMQRIGCLGGNAVYQGAYRLLSAAHVLTGFDRENIGGEILVRNNEGDFVPIGATVTGQVHVELYDTPDEEKAVFSNQDLAWANIRRDIGSPKIDGITETPRRIRRISCSDSVVKYCAGYSCDLGSEVDVENHADDTVVKIVTTNGATKYAYFEDLCRIKPFETLLDSGDSGTAIVAESDNDLVGILIAMNDAVSSSNIYYFCKFDDEVKSSTPTP